MSGVDVQEAELQHQRIHRHRAGVIGHEHGRALRRHVRQPQPLSTPVVLPYRPQDRQEHLLGELRVEAKLVDLVVAGGAASQGVQQPTDMVGLERPDPVGLRPGGLPFRSPPRRLIDPDDLGHRPQVLARRKS